MALQAPDYTAHRDKHILKLEPFNIVATDLAHLPLDNDRGALQPLISLTGLPA